MKNTGSLSMLSKAKKMVRGYIKGTGSKSVSTSDPISRFHSTNYLRHNARRLEHLASLRIRLAGMSVLEVGAGIGDHSHYYIDRDCKITITEARPENIKYLRERYPSCNIQFLDMEHPTRVNGSPFDVVHCYGLLYHLGKPEQALSFLSKNTNKMLFLETCVSFGDREEIRIISEQQTNPTEAFSGTGCRPTRAWLFKRLQGLFEHVYIPRTQPNHEEFPIDWTAPEKHQANLKRAIFIASRERLENEILTSNLINKQTRHE
jgi:hypothetical protein